MQMELADTQEVEEPTPTPSNILTNADRCDQCGAQAFIWVNMPDSQNGLLYCVHHFNRNEAALRKVAIDFIDERHKVNAKASSSSPD